MLLGILLILLEVIISEFKVFLSCNYDAYIFGALPSSIIIYENLFLILIWYQSKNSNPILFFKHPNFSFSCLRQKKIYCSCEQYHMILFIMNSVVNNVWYCSSKNLKWKRMCMRLPSNGSRQGQRLGEVEERWGDPAAAITDCQHPDTCHNTLLVPSPPWHTV